jgi:hypothetical protein
LLAIEPVTQMVGALRVMLLYATNHTPKGTEPLLGIPANGTIGELFTFLPIPQIPISYGESLETSDNPCSFFFLVRKPLIQKAWWQCRTPCPTVGSGNSEPLIPEILSRSAWEGKAWSKFR